MNKTLLIMAAGMGSRFGGLKQIEPIGPNGEFLIDYSVYDAIKAGFTKVVFIIKEENYNVFKETIGARVEGKIKVEYVFQKQTDIPEGFSVPEGREKPWGTAHAILCSKNNINEPFAVINADDFYGFDAYKTVAQFLDNNINNDWACIGYFAANTLSLYGSTKRGVCNVEGEKLIGLTESIIERVNGVITAAPLDGRPSFTISDQTPVSMNMFGFTPDLFPILENGLVDFFKNSNDLMKKEFLIPDVVEKCTMNDIKQVFVKQTIARWLGMTYQQDKEEVRQAIIEFIEQGEYPNNLWE